MRILNGIIVVIIVDRACRNDVLANIFACASEEFSFKNIISDQRFRIRRKRKFRIRLAKDFCLVICRDLYRIFIDVTQACFLLARCSQYIVTGIFSGQLYNGNMDRLIRTHIGIFKCACGFQVQIIAFHHSH